MWEATLKNGTKASETTHKWSEIKKDIDTLIYRYDGTEYVFPPSDEYIQYKTASAPLTGGKAEIESQTVGCVLNNKKIMLRFDFKNKKVNISVE